MRFGRTFQNYTPQQMLTAYRNRTVVAVWLLVLSGGLTIAEPFTLFDQRQGVALGFVAPNLLATLAGAGAGSVMHIGPAAAGGGLMIALGILAGRGRKSAAILGAALLVVEPGARRQPRRRRDGATPRRRSIRAERVTSVFDPLTTHGNEAPDVGACPGTPPDLAATARRP